MNSISKEKLKIIYILSSGHSGSTLLDLILGSHSKIESAGEIFRFGDFMSLNSKRPDNKRICTCGVHVNECNFWNLICAELKNSFGENAIEQKFGNERESDVSNYNILKTILSVSKKQTFCDSSKCFNRLKMMLNSNLFEVFVIYLVRDGRAVAFSNKKKKRSYYRYLFEWQRKNKHFLSLQKRNVHHFLLRYEDFVSNPERYISLILKEISLEFEKGQMQFWRFPHHNLSGNRLRNKGKQVIQRDIDYLDCLSFFEWWVGTLLLMPALRRFGYGLRKKDCKINI